MATNRSPTPRASTHRPRHHARRRRTRRRLLEVRLPGGQPGAGGLGRARPEGGRCGGRARIPPQPRREQPAPRTTHRLDRGPRPGPEQRFLQRGPASDRGPRALSWRRGDGLQHRGGPGPGTRSRRRPGRAPDRRPDPDARESRPGLPRRRPCCRARGGRRRPTPALHPSRRRRRGQPGRRCRGDRSPARPRAPADRLPRRQRRDLDRGGTPGRLPDGAAGLGQSAPTPTSSASTCAPGTTPSRRPGSCWRWTSRRLRSSRGAT